MTLGCKAYLDAQQRACYCPGSSNQNGQNYQQKPGKDRDKYSGKKPKDKRNYGWKANDEV